MVVAGDLLLLLTDDRSGMPVVDGTRRDIAVAGAVIAELATAGRLGAVTSPRRLPDDGVARGRLGARGGVRRP